MEPVWKLITLKQYPVFSRQWILEAFRDEQARAIGLGFKNYKSLETGIYADEAELKRLEKLLAVKLEESPDEVLGLCGDWRRCCDSLVSLAREVEATNLEEKSDDELVELLRVLVGKFKETAAYIFLAHALGDHLELWLKKLLARKVGDPKKRIQYQQVLTTPRKKTSLHDAHTRLLEIAGKVAGKKIGDLKNIEEIQLDVEQYTRDYRWLGYDTGVGRDFTLDDTLKKLEGILENPPDTGHSKARDFEEVVDELSLSARERELLDLMGELIFGRAYRGECNSKAGMHARPLLMEVARRCGTDYDSLVYLTFGEIEECLKRKKVDDTVVAERRNAFGLVMLDGEIKIFSGDSVKQLEDVEAVDGVSEVRGVMANPGFVVGTARIVTRASDFEKVQAGDILVSKNTTPEFILVIEKCAGIVTDVGGVTSHAAIVSRELNKPCVVGTGNATQVFRDGDLVEVDADNAVARFFKN